MTGQDRPSRFLFLCLMGAFLILPLASTPMGQDSSRVLTKATPVAPSFADVCCDDCVQDPVTDTCACLGYAWIGEFPRWSSRFEVCLYCTFCIFGFPFPKPEPGPYFPANVQLCFPPMDVGPKFLTLKRTLGVAR